MSANKTRRPTVTIAANNGEIGGGEVMLLRIATALRDIGVPVAIVAPAWPAGVADAARAAGFDVVALRARGRRGWMWALRRWDGTQRRGLLWCNGLVPATATAGHPGRIVHLHQHPVREQRVLASIARRGATEVVVPSVSMLGSVPGATVLPNWTDAFAPTLRARKPGEPFVVGVLGRVSFGKGIDVLARAMKTLDERRPGAFRLRIAGESRFVAVAHARRVHEVLQPVATLTDRVGWADAGEFFDSIDLLVVPSVASESFGLVAAEAMAARTPVLVTDAGALPEVVGGAYPLVVPAGDASALANRIDAVASGVAMVDVDAQYERWRAEYSPEAGARRLRSLLETLEER